MKNVGRSNCFGKVEMSVSEAEVKVSVGKD